MGTHRTLALMSLGLAVGLAPGLADAKGRHGHRHHAVEKPVEVAVTTMAKARVFAMATDPGRTAAVVQAVRAHESGEKPAGWAEMVARVRAEKSLARKLVLVDGYIDGGLIPYRDRDGSVWARSPAQAARAGGLCRDYAVAKVLLLSEAGVPGRDIRIVSLSPNLNHIHYHVVVAVRDEEKKKVFILDMSKQDQAKGPRAVEVNTIDDTTDRLPIAIVGFSAWEPLQQAALGVDVAGEGR